jgi:uncharacterized protein YjiS (DUF1127 family)
MMEGTGTLNLSPTQRHASFARFEVLGSLLSAAAEKIWAWLVARADAARSAAVRRELHRMSDHYLRDIGLTRTDIDALFR